MFFFNKKEEIKLSFWSLKRTEHRPVTLQMISQKTHSFRLETEFLVIIFLKFRIIEFKTFLIWIKLHLE